jgi:hypothetical protein
MRIWSFLSCALLACGDKSDSKPPPVVGATSSAIARSGEFSYKCASAGDAYCSDNALFGASFPEFAVGSQSDFFFKSNAGGAERPIAGVVSTNRLKLEENGRITALLPGKAGILATDANGAPVDAFNLTLRSRAKLKFEALKGVLGFHVWPEDDKGQPLAGALSCEWTIDDPSIARITPGPTSTRIELVPGKNGKTILHLKYAGELNSDIPVEINL